MRTFLITITALIVGGVIGLYVLAPRTQQASQVAATEASAGTAAESLGAPVSWKMAGAFPASLVQLGTLGKRYEARVNDISAGNIEIKYFEPGALVSCLS